MLDSLTCWAWTILSQLERLNLLLPNKFIILIAYVNCDIAVFRFPSITPWPVLDGSFPGRRNTLSDRNADPSPSLPLHHHFVFYAPQLPSHSSRPVPRYGPKIAPYKTWRRTSGPICIPLNAVPDICHHAAYLTGSAISTKIFLCSTHNAQVQPANPARQNAENPRIAMEKRSTGRFFCRNNNTCFYDSNKKLPRLPSESRVDDCQS